MDPEDVAGIADALVRILGDPGLARRLGAAAFDRSHEWTYDAAEYGRRMRALADRVAG